MKKYKNIIFDVGNVLLSYRWKDMFQYDYGMSEKLALEVGTEMFSDPLWQEYDLWNKTEEEIIRGFEEKYKEHGPYIRWFIEHGERMKVERHAVWQKVKELKDAGYGIYILSNYPKSLYEKHMKGTEVLKSVDGEAVSYMMHKAKPGKEIYEYLFDTYGLDAADCLFFDDRAENIKGAYRCGMDAKQVLSEEGLLLDLAALLNGGFELS